MKLENIWNEYRHSLKSWLFQIANHAIIDFYRRNGRTKEVEQSDLWLDKTEAAHTTLTLYCMSCIYIARIGAKR